MSKIKKQPTKRVKAKAPPQAPTPQTPDRYFPESRVNKIAELALGESIAEAIRVSFSDLDQNALADTRTRLRNSMNRAVATARERSGNSYNIEVGEFITATSNNVCVVIVVTRTDETL